MNNQQQPTQNERRRPMEEEPAIGGGGVSQNQNQNPNPHPGPQQCPRCHSSNTKFCYYNNYSLSQPRYFCKGCRRYWTQGGTLRNVPVGGGCRKSKRPKLITTASSPSSTQSLTAAPIPQYQQIDPSINIDNSTTNNNSPHPLLGTAINSNHPFLGTGFLSSLTGMQAGAQPIRFGPNLGLLHGLGLPGFQHQQQNQEDDQQPPSFQQLLQQRHSDHHSLYPGTHIGLVPSTNASSSSGDWNLTNNVNNNINNNNNNSNINNNSNNKDDNSSNNNSNNNPNEQWPFLSTGRTGLEEP